MRCGAAVRPAYQGTGAGRYLAEQAIVWAASNGYTRVLLDTLPSMQRAQRLYERLGFRDAGAYRPNPVQGVRYMSLDL
jgi:putative acetyltransferase